MVQPNGTPLSNGFLNLMLFENRMLENSLIRVDVGSLEPYKVMEFRGDVDITCAFTSWSPPLQDAAFNQRFNETRTEVWLDLNILSNASAPSTHSNIKDLIEWAKDNDYAISLKMAIYEKYRTNHKNPIEHILNSAKGLAERHGVSFDPSELQRQCRILARYASGSRDFETLTLSVIVVRMIFNSSGSYQEKVNRLANYMARHIVPSTTVLLVSSLLFYLDEILEPSSPLRKKLRNDMKITGDASEDRKKAHNIASDIGLFSFSSWPQFDFDNATFPIIGIATSDRILALLLREMCHCHIDVTGDTHLQTPAYRLGSESEKNLNPLVKNLIRRFSEIDPASKSQRISNAERLADLILEGKCPPDL